MSRDPSESRPLSELLVPLAGFELRGDVSIPIRDVAYASGEVTVGSLFFCFKGQNADGHEFAAEAVERGARALMVERWLPLGVAQVRVPSVREAMGPVSAEAFGRPGDAMTVVGVTGTNGKTTTTYLLESVFAAAGMTPGLVGTTGVRIAGEALPAVRTTPEAPDLHRLLRRMLDAGVRAVAMEASSHGLHQHRIGGLRCACAVFTNLSQDHLDYHGTIEEYFLAKARLFTLEMTDRAALNWDSPEGRRLMREDIPAVTFGLQKGADVRATKVRLEARGIAFAVDGLHLESPLRGAFNVQNCLAALAASRSLGLPDAVVRDGLRAVHGVPGRFEPIDEGQPYAVLVDYAHTPDGLENVLVAAGELAQGRLIVVFGCGGDRDRGKRPLMGQAATTLADLTIVTSDNPRSEDPLVIVAEIEPGAREGGGAYEVEPERRAAIRRALEAASPGDVVVIAGKGHETGQQFADRTVPFDDRLVAAEELRLLRGGA